MPDPGLSLDGLQPGSPDGIPGVDHWAGPSPPTPGPSWEEVQLGPHSRLVNPTNAPPPAFRRRGPSTSSQTVNRGPRNSGRTCRAARASPPSLPP